MKTLRDYINVVLEADAPAGGNARERARAYRQRTANTSAPADQQPAGNAYDAVAGTPPAPAEQPAQAAASAPAEQPAQAAAPAPAPAPQTPAAAPSRGRWDQNGPVGDAVDAIKNWWNAPKPAQPAPATPVARAPAPQAQGASPTPAVDPKVAALQKEIQSIKANIAASANDPRAVKDYNVQLYGAQSDLAKLTGQPAPTPVAGSSAAYGNPQIAKQGQQQQINKGQEELRVAQASGDKAAADAAQAKIDQATANKADITFADADTPYGTKSGKNLTPSTGPVPQAQAAAPTPAPKPTPAPAPKPKAAPAPEPEVQARPLTMTTISQAEYEKKMADVNAMRQQQGQAPLPITPAATAPAPAQAAPQRQQNWGPVGAESMSHSDKALLEKMLTIAGLK